MFEMLLSFELSSKPCPLWRAPKGSSFKLSSKPHPFWRLSFERSSTGFNNKKQRCAYIVIHVFMLFSIFAQRCLRLKNIKMFEICLSFKLSSKLCHSGGSPKGQVSNLVKV